MSNRFAFRVFPVLATLPAGCNDLIEKLRSNVLLGTDGTILHAASTGRLALFAGLPQQGAGQRATAVGASVGLSRPRSLGRRPRGLAGYRPRVRPPGVSATRDGRGGRGRVCGGTRHRAHQDQHCESSRHGYLPPRAAQPLLLADGTGRRNAQDRALGCHRRHRMAIIAAMRHRPPEIGQPGLAVVAAGPKL